MELLIVIIKCITLIICVYIITDIRVTIKQEQPHVETEPVTEADLAKAYESLDKDPVPDFADVIEAINKEFGGIDSE